MLLFVMKAKMSTCFFRSISYKHLVWVLAEVISFSKRSYLTVRGVVEQFSAPCSLLDEKLGEAEEKDCLPLYFDIWDLPGR